MLYSDLEFTDSELARLQERCDRTGKTLSQVLQDIRNEQRDPGNDYGSKVARRA